MANLNFRSQQEFMEYISNPASYKQTRKKQYQIWACMPPAGTKVSNFLEQANYMTDDSHRFVLSGTQGEQWVIGVEKLAKTYDLAAGGAITKESLTQLQKRNGGSNIDWFKVATKADGGMAYCACFVPASIQFQIPTSWGTVLTGNRQGIPHGKGDFILCPCVNGQPNLNDRWIVNGKVFGDTYDNRGFTEYLDTNSSQQSGEVPKPKTLITGASAQAGVAVAQKTARELVARLKAVGSEVPAKMQEICTLKITDFKYDCKAEQVADDLGKKLLAECRVATESQVADAKKAYSNSGASQVCFRASIQGFVYKPDEALKFVTGLREVSCFDVIEIVECQSLHIAPKKHSTRFVITADASGKYYCLLKPTSHFSFIIAPLDGSIQLPLADDVLKPYVSWIPTDSLALLSPIKSNWSALINPELAKLAAPIDGIEFVKVTPKQLNNDSRRPVPNQLYEIHGAGKDKGERYGYCAVYAGYVDEKQDKRLPKVVLQSPMGSNSYKCMNHDVSANIFDVGSVAADFIWRFVHSLRELLGETREEQDKRVLNSALALKFDVTKLIEYHSRAVKSGAELPATILDDTDLMSGKPLKDILIDEIILPSDKLTVDFHAMESSTQEHFRCNIIMLLITYAIIKLYEKTPYALQLRGEPYGFGIENIKDDGCRLMLHTANKASFSYSWVGLVRWENDSNPVEKNTKFGDEVNPYDLYTRYFKSGKTLAQVAEACYSHVSALASLRDYVYKTLRFGASGKGTVSEEDENYVQTFMSAMAARLTYISEIISSSIGDNCGLRPADIKYECKLISAPVSAGESYLTEFRRADKNLLWFRGALREMAESDKEAFVTGLKIAGCFTTHQQFECRSLAVQPLQTQTNYVVVSYNGKHYCIAAPSFMPKNVLKDTDYKYIIVPMDDGASMDSVVDDLVEDRDRWIPWVSSNVYAYFVNNTATVASALAPELSAVLREVNVSEISANQANSKVMEKPTHLYEYTRAGAVLGYYATYDSMSDSRTKKPDSYFYSSSWGRLSDCATPYMKSSVYNFAKEVCDIAHSYVNGIHLILGETKEQNIERGQEERVSLRIPLMLILLAYANAVGTEIQMPSTICTDYSNIGSGTPLKNLAIEKVIVPCDTLNFGSLSEVAKSRLACTAVSVIMLASLIKFYERNPQNFKLSTSLEGGHKCFDLEVFRESIMRVIVRTDIGSCAFSVYHGFSYWENDECIDSEEDLSDDIVNFAFYKDHFSTGKTVMEVAESCIAAVPQLKRFDAMITKMMESTASMDAKAMSPAEAQEKLAALKNTLDMRYPFPHTLKLYSDAAWDGCCRLPDTMMTDYSNLGAGTPVKDMPIEQLMPSSEEVDMKLITLDEEAMHAMRVMTVMALTFASLAKCYEHSPYTFLLRRGSNGLSITEDQKNLYLRAGDAFFRYTDGEGFALGVNEQVVESTPLSADLLDTFNKHFKSGTSLFKVASSCFKVPGLGAINRYITKVMSYASSDTAVKGLLLEGISFYYDCFNVSINPEDCKAFLTDATKDTVRAELHFAKYDTDSGSKMQTVQSDDTTTLFFTLKDSTLTVRGRRDNKDIKRVYKIGDGAGIGSLCARSFIDVCRSLKLHPAKVLYSSKSLWRNIFRAVQETTPGFYYRLTNLETSDERSNIDVRIQIATKQDPADPKSQFKVLGERTIRVHLNYEAFDMTLNTSATMASFNEDVSGADALSVLRVKVSLLGASAQTQQEETGDSIMYPYALATYIVRKLFVSYFQTTKKYGGILTQRA